MVYSFDVFDTLITRSTATPDGIFAIMQRRLQDNQDLDYRFKSNFYELRIGAEQVARNTYCKNGIEDVTLEQIYRVFVQENRISQEQSLLLQELECDTELEYVFAIPDNLSRVKDLLEKKEKVILISDMYLDAEVIRKLLIKADPVLGNIPLYVSSDADKKNKYSGNLFQIVKEKENLQYEHWKHVGDNPHSDYQVPKRLGITGELYPREELLEIERTYFVNGRNDPEKQLLLGCARLARILGKKNHAYDLGCSIGGPLLYPYVKWIYIDCLKRGINRLYFVARDGYILKELAEQISIQERAAIEIKYIYGSRKAWRIPQQQNFEHEMMDIYEGSYKDRIFCAADLAEFFQIPEEKLKHFLPGKLSDPKLVWTMQTVNLLLHYLLGLPDFLEELYQVYNRKKELLIEYLQQEIDAKDDHFAFVDLAGSGLTQECLAKVMKTFYPGKVKNYFYRKDCLRESICDDKVFYPNYIPYYVLLEMLCRAPHDQTIGYEKDTSGRIIPVFAEVDKDEIIRHQVPEFIQGARKFAEIYGQVICKYGDVCETVRCVLPYLEYIYRTPDNVVLNYFADIPNMLTGREKQVTCYAPRLSDREIKNIFWYREQESIEYFYHGSSFEYSLKRCTEEQKKRINKYTRLYPTVYGRFCRKLHKRLVPASTVRAANFYDCIAQNIAVYGAGKLGQRFYRQITGAEKVNGVRYSSNVVLWMDRDFLEYQNKGMPVYSPAEAVKQEYQQLIIAVAKKEIAEEIKASLLELGVNKSKIIWIKACTE